MGVTKKKCVIVNSVPKAGTHLAYEVLKKMGLRDSSLFLNYDDKGIGVYDYQYAPTHLLHREKVRYWHPMPFPECLRMVRQRADFAIGHIPPFAEAKEHLFPGYKVVFLVRDLRDCLISHMRYMIAADDITKEAHPWCTLEDKKERFKQYLIHYAEEVGPLVYMKLIASWEYDIHDPWPGMELFKLRFEDIVAQDAAVSGGVLRSLAEFLNIDLLEDADALLKSAFGAETLTKSGQRTQRDQYWSPFAEQWFNDRITDAQGNNVNQLLGYS